VRFLSSSSAKKPTVQPKKSILKVRTRHKPFYLIPFLLLPLAGPADADRLYTTGGESIPGSLLGINDGKLLWSSEIFGDLIIDQHHIQRIESGNHFDFKLSGRELNNCWLFHQDDHQLLHCDEGVEMLSDWKLVVAAGEAVNDPPPLLVQKGSVNVAAEDSSGNTNIDKINVAARSEIRFIESRHTLNLRYQEEQADGAQSRNMWRSGYQYDQFFTEQWFVAGNASYEEDEFKEIDQRSLVGVGMGYQFLETSYIDLLGKGTLNYVDEQFTSSRGRATPAFLWNMDFSWRFNDRGMEFFHRHALLQALEDGDDFELTSMTGFKYPINGHFNSVIQLEYDYDNRPAQDAVDKKDQKWSVGLNYDW
jgi:putative salt-induced outer membrane protein YdiY